METTLANGKKTIRPKEGHVRKVKENWRVFEDHCLASREQDQEFDSHYNQNRTERQQMRTDVPLSKDEQKLEDKYAEEYWQQVRLDREKDDEKLALEMQRKIDLEMEMEQQRVTETDQEYARRIDAKEKERMNRRRAESNPPQDEATAREMQDYLRSIGDELPAWEGAVPAGMHLNGWNTMRMLRRKGHQVTIPHFFSQQQHMDVQSALEKEDAVIAQEQQDKYLARWMQRQEKRMVQHETAQDRHQQETMDNHRNMARSNEVPTGDLINFDDPDPQPETSTLYPPQKQPPPRPAPPNVSRNGEAKIPKGAVRVLPYQ